LTGCQEGAGESWPFLIAAQPLSAARRRGIEACPVAYPGQSRRARIADGSLERMHPEGFFIEVT